MVIYLFGALISSSSIINNSEYIYDRDRIFSAFAQAYPDLISIVSNSENSSDTNTNSSDTNNSNVILISESNVLSDPIDSQGLKESSSTVYVISESNISNSVSVESNIDILDSVSVESNVDILSSQSNSKISNIHNFPEIALKVRDKLFYWVNNRILPESAKEDWEKYGVTTFYLYPQEIRNPSNYTKMEIKNLHRRASKSFRKRRVAENPEFMDTLYNISTASDTNNQIVNTLFLNYPVNIHAFLQKPLKRVELDIKKLSETDPEVKDFIATVDTVYSFFWRTIAGSKFRSFHSYGLAIDLLDSKSKGSYYWLWRQNQKIDWITEPLSVRWNIPDSIVKIFEKYGFVWGGKWIFYDVMHFEYRPELLILNGYSVELVNLEKHSVSN